MNSPLPPTWDVPSSLRVRVGTTVGKQRLIVEEGHLLVLLHAIPDPDDPTRREPRLFWRSPEGRWRSSTREADATITPLRAHVDSFHAAVEALEERVERASSADDWFGILHELAPFVRTSRNLARVLQEVRERLPGDRDVVAIRDRATDVERASELVHQWASQGLDYSIARANEEQARLSEVIARSGHRLNRLAALTLPLTALGALLGTNLRSGIEDFAAPYLFWGFGVATVILGVLVQASMPDPAPRSAVTPGPTPRTDASRSPSRTKPTPRSRP